MPIINNATTRSSSLSWESPDKKIKIYDVVMQGDGKIFKCRTFSGVIAISGWNGDVETYEKPNKDGSLSTYIKQAPKEDAPHSGASSAASVSKQDNYTMYLSYAKDLAVALLQTSGDFDSDKFAFLLDEVSRGGDTLFKNHTDPLIEDGDIPIIEDL